MTATIIQGNVFDVLPAIPPGSVDACVTSPPYWALRSYLGCECGHTRTSHAPGCRECGCKRYKEHPLKPLELGSEKTPAEYVASMVRVFALVRECLADHGTCWVNIGDTYASGSCGGSSVFASGRTDGKPGDGGKAKLESAREGTKDRPGMEGIDSGNLCLIPQRLAIALQDSGWIVRSVIVWRKPAPMPASLAGWRWMRCRVKVKSDEAPSGYRADRPECDPNGDGVHYDHRRPPNALWSDCPGCPKCEPNGGFVLRKGSWRPTSSWEPILMLAKKQGYFADGEPVKTASGGNQNPRPFGKSENGDRQDGDHLYEGDTSGANARDVQTWAAEPLKEKHYAAFPTALAEWCLRAATSARGYCPKCGKPWCRVVEVRGVNANRNGKTADKIAEGLRTALGGAEHDTAETTTLDWRPSCSCPAAEPRPGRVLDPFAGSGRSGIAALRLGLDFTGVELNPEYADMAKRLLREESPLFA